jgi:hypothetical protein
LSSLLERQLDHPLEKLITGTAAKFGGIVKLQKIPKVTLAFFGSGSETT